MSRRVCVGRLLLGLAFALASVIAVRQTSAAPGRQQIQNPNSWTLPQDADDTKSPLTVDAKVLAAGKAVYTDKCKRCHGPAGLGDGPDADPDVADDMNLTNPKRADRNSDGIVFYKVLNGRKKPKMPAFKDELSKDQIWQVVAYVQTLRKK